MTMYVTSTMTSPVTKTQQKNLKGIGLRVVRLFSPKVSV